MNMTRKCHNHIPQRNLLHHEEETLEHRQINRGGGGGTLIFSFIRRLGSFFWSKILNFNILLGFQKNDFLGGMKILWVCFWDHHKIGLSLRVNSMHFRVLS